MKNLYLIICLLTGHGLYAQSEILETNQVRTQINSNGALFTETASSRAAYEVPNTSGTGPNVIYANALWFGALDQNSEVHLSNSGFASTTTPGPIANNYASQTYIDRYDHVYSVSASEIQTHQQNWNNPNYVMPDDILNWPGNGDVSNGEASVLAAFVDYNANNIYEPNLGDHPVIRGDRAHFFIINDMASARDSAYALALGMEFHVMVYQFLTAGTIDSTTFFNVKVINRSQNTYDQFIGANYTDFDIGGPSDDYFGCSSDKNMMFGYNGDLLDNGQSGSSPMFGPNPPACGIKFLNHDMAASGYFSQFFNINVSETIWNNMNGNWGDGLPFTEGGNGYGGTIPTSFIYDGNPNDTSLWTEITAQFSPSDRRGFIAAEPIDGFAPGDYICYDYAVLYSRTGGSAFLNVNGLFNAADDVQAFYDAESFFYCEPLLLGVNDAPGKESDISIYPNPAQHEFRVSADGVFDVAVYDLTGKRVFSKNGVNSNDILSTPKEAGIYLVQINSKGKLETLKLIVQ